MDHVFSARATQDGSGGADVAGVDQAGGEALQADGEAAVGWPAVGEHVEADLRRWTEQGLVLSPWWRQRAGHGSRVTCREGSVREYEVPATRSPNLQPEH